jgi:hypothetical protein
MIQNKNTSIEFSHQYKIINIKIDIFLRSQNLSHSSYFSNNFLFISQHAIHDKNKILRLKFKYLKLQWLIYKNLKLKESNYIYFQRYKTWKYCNYGKTFKIFIFYLSSLYLPKVILTLYVEKLKKTLLIMNRKIKPKKLFN